METAMELAVQRSRLMQVCWGGKSKGLFALVSLP